MLKKRRRTGSNLSTGCFCRARGSFCWHLPARTLIVPMVNSAWKSRWTTLLRILFLCSTISLIMVLSQKHQSRHMILRSWTARASYRLGKKTQIKRYWARYGQRSYKLRTTGTWLPNICRQNIRASPMWINTLKILKTLPRQKPFSRSWSNERH